MTENRLSDVLARIALDPAFAEHARVDPQAVADEYGLDAKAVATLESLSVTAAADGPTPLAERLSRSSLFFGGSLAAAGDVHDADAGSGEILCDGLSPADGQASGKSVDLPGIGVNDLGSPDAHDYYGPAGGHSLLDGGGKPRIIGPEGPADIIGPAGPRAGTAADGLREPGALDKDVLIPGGLEDRPGGPGQGIPGFDGPGGPGHGIPGFDGPGGPGQGIPGFDGPGGPGHGIPGFDGPGGPGQGIPGFDGPGGPVHGLTGFEGPGGPGQGIPGFDGPGGPGIDDSNGIPGGVGIDGEHVAIPNDTGLASGDHGAVVDQWKTPYEFADGTHTAVSSEFADGHRMTVEYGPHGEVVGQYDTDVFAHGHHDHSEHGSGAGGDSTGHQGTTTAHPSSAEEGPKRRPRSPAAPRAAAPRAAAPRARHLGRRHLGRRHLGRRHLGRRHLGRRHLGRRHLGRRHHGRRHHGTARTARRRSACSRQGSRRRWRGRCRPEPRASGRRGGRRP